MWWQIITVHIDNHSYNNTALSIEPGKFKGRKRCDCKSQILLARTGQFITPDSYNQGTGRSLTLTQITGRFLPPNKGKHYQLVYMR